MTPLDRAALADALASASPETLREDAEVCRSALAYAGNDRTAASLQRLAALALATAALMERAEREASNVGYNPSEVRWTVDSDGDTHWRGARIYDDEPRTLPAALAALLKGDQ